MAEIHVEPLGEGEGEGEYEGEYEVRVAEGGSATSHRVHVPAELRAELGLDEDDDRRLVQASFEFLLEREPKESILARFELAVIGRYFPEYPGDIRQRLKD